jgi:hypothetical protein
MRARRLRAIAVSLFVVIAFQHSFAQDLSPRAYLITPLHANALTLTWSFYDGGINLSGSIPITGASGTYHVPSIGYYHSLNFFGRSSNITIVLPYGVGTFAGDVFGAEKSVYRSGLLDLSVRFSVNLIGGRAMPLDEFAKWKQKTLLGASVRVIAPTGQYSGTKLLNWGLNRWAIKPEIGYSHRSGKWIVDAYGGAWFFTTNNAFFSARVPRPQTEGPVGSFEGHLSRELGKSPRFWASLDGNYWFGGTTTLGGVPRPDTRQSSSRLGGTFALPITKHQALKFAYSVGTYIRFGGNYHNTQVAWQYSWIGWPK